MKKFFTLCFLITVSFFCLIGCRKKERQVQNKTYDINYIDYIAEYTSGIISCKSGIIIRLVRAVDLTDEKIALKKNVVRGILKISPSISGETVWKDSRTIVLQPDKIMPSGQKYTVNVNLKYLYPDIPESLQSFAFSFQVLTQNFNVSIDETTFAEKNYKKVQNVTGLVNTADWADDKELEKMLTARFRNKDYAITWDHAAGENKHRFFISDIEREKKSFSIELFSNGSVINVNKKDSLKVPVYGLDDFRYLSNKLFCEPDLVLNVQFSMPLDEKQNLDGIINVKGDSNPRFLIENNLIRIYPSGSHKNTIQVMIDKALKDSSGEKLKESADFYVTFRQEKPKIRWVRKHGGILPSTDGLILPFEAITLKAVDVSVIEVRENNIVQFLQVNKDIKGKRELKRVGRPIMQKTISLDNNAVKNLYVYNRFNLNLADAVEMQPGSLYQVRINFRPLHSLYTCSGSNSELALKNKFPAENWDSPKESSHWDYWDDYYYDDYWSSRDNPCKLAYYGKNREISLNILASDIGIMAKGSEKGELRIFTADIKNTQVLSNVDIEIFNFQQQLMQKGKTDSKGMVFFQLEQKPYVIIAKRNRERGYLRIDDATAISMSSFDVGGTDSKKGIKGFLYGERGVWRPGDTIYLNFILEDKQKNLPKNHPVIFELRNPLNQLEKRIVKTENIGGIYNFKTETDSQAPTGNWEAIVQVGGQVLRKKIKIETIKPNRLKINLDFGKEVITAQDGDLKGNLEVKWLHGAVAKNLQAEFDLVLAPIKTHFKDFPNYIFDDPSLEFFSEKENVFTGRLDENGQTSFDLRINAAEKSPGALKAIFTGKVYEQGGNFSIDKLTIPYFPYTSFVGLKTPSGNASRGMLLTDKDHPIDIVSVDSYGKPVSRNKLEIEVYKLNWKWWWDKSSENLANYISRNYHQIIMRDRINTRNGKALWKLRINYPSWGRYLLRIYDPVSRHSAGKVFYIDWPGWAGAGKNC